ncbi:MAG: hypothetical protein D3923_05210, partial [Candidatus Electrothrix sp. AR3]|nr:hypothetical protein [Candidatus Electrothrix sp. AR3]
MYQNHLNLTGTPFSEKPNPDIFFPEADRTKILRAVYADLQQDKSIVRMTGTKGTGKTLLCLLLVRLIPDKLKVVYLDSPTGSFDTLLHAVCLELGMQSVHAQDMLAELYTLVEQYK